MEKTAFLDALVEEGLGYLKTSDAVEAGVSRAFVGDYVRANGMERVAKGLYRAQDAWDDGMFVLQTRYPGAVFSHETALFLLGLTDREPDRYSITLKAGASSSNLAREGVRVHKVNSELFSLGVIEVQTPFGHTVRKRIFVEAQELQGALKSYVRRKGKDIPLLMHYAKALSVEKVLSRYLEVLL